MSLQIRMIDYTRNKLMSTARMRRVSTGRLNSLNFFVVPSALEYAFRRTISEARSAASFSTQS